MRWQVQMLLFIMCLNLACWLALNPYVGIISSYSVQPWNPSVNASEYESHFNATQIGKGWQASPYVGIPVIGDIYSGFQFLFVMIEYLIAGFPLFLLWIDNAFIVGESAHLAFLAITTVISALYAVVMAFFFIEFISGRILHD